ncbi:hypothetical protein SpCBS45565_g05595 [Spizellomyces sp. 'palustris']|nr:hypothetical protein SpCBS45565_g05595 [Spizellomyces sp. 'palustris']
MSPSTLSASACHILPSTLSHPKQHRPSAPLALVPPTKLLLSFSPTDSSIPSTDATFNSFRSKRDAVIPPNTTEFQYSIHKPSRHLLRDLALIFPNLKTRSAGLEDLVIVPTFQKTVHDLVAVSGETNWERDLLLEYVYAWATRVVSFLRHLNYWADMTDPASGYPMFSSRGSCIYPDVDGSVRLLRYATVQAGCCRILVHPTWGTRNYPATLFSTAPAHVLREVIDAVARDPIPMTISEIVDEAPAVW